MQRKIDPGTWKVKGSIICKCIAIFQRIRRCYECIYAYFSIPEKELSNEI